MLFASSKHAYLGAMPNLRSIWRKEQNNKLRLLHRDLRLLHRELSFCFTKACCVEAKVYSSNCTCRGSSSQFWKDVWETRLNINRGENKIGRRNPALNQNLPELRRTARFKTSQGTSTSHQQAKTTWWQRNYKTWWKLRYIFLFKETSIKNHQRSSQFLLLERKNIKSRPPKNYRPLLREEQHLASSSGKSFRTRLGSDSPRTQLVRKVSD